MRSLGYPPSNKGKDAPLPLATSPSVCIVPLRPHRPELALFTHPLLSPDGFGVSQTPTPSAQVIGRIGPLQEDPKLVRIPPASGGFGLVIESFLHPFAKPIITKLMIGQKIQLTNNLISPISPRRPSPKMRLALAPDDVGRAARPPSPPPDARTSECRQQAFRLPRSVLDLTAELPFHISPPQAIRGSE